VRAALQAAGNIHKEKRRRREAVDRLVLLGMHLQPINHVVFMGS
jgi:hypothetical protein